MSDGENPTLSRQIATYDALWDEAFAYARHLLDKNAPRDEWEADHGRKTVYYDQLPMIAKVIHQDMIQLGHYVMNNKETDVQEGTTAELAVVTEFRKIRSRRVT